MFAKQQSILSKHQSERSTPPAPSVNAAVNSLATNHLGSDHGNVVQRTPASRELAPDTNAARDRAAQMQTQAQLQAQQQAQQQAQMPSGIPGTEQDGRRLFVGPEVKLKGAEILDCDTLHVEGRVEATMDSRVLQISKGGAFNGKVGIDVAEIHGEFEGELTARQQLVIHATGRVRGKIRYGQLVIENGGVLSGDIQSLNETRPSPLATTAPISPVISPATDKEVPSLNKHHLSTVAG